MKVYILIFLLIAVQLATSTTLDKIGEKVQAGIRILKDKAITKLHKLKAEIELKKLHQLHVTHFLPYAHNKHYVQEHYSKKTPLIVDPHQIHKLSQYFETHHQKLHYVPPPVHHHYEHHHIGHH